MTLARALGVVLFAAGLAAIAAPVGAIDCPGGEGILSQNALISNVCAPGAPTSSGNTAGASSASGGTNSATANKTSSGGSSEPNPYKWSREYLDGYAFPDDWVGPKSVPPDPNCDAANGAQNCTQYDRGGIPIPRTCTGPGGEAGRPYRDTLTDTRTGEVVSSAEGCSVPGVASAAPTGSAGSPAPPPPPPTAAEVIQASNLPRLQFGLSPKGKDCSIGGVAGGSASTGPACGSGEAPGLTGLETLLWVEPAPPAEVTVTVNIRGYSVTSRARPVRYSWRMRQDGDTESSRNPDPSITTTAPGSRDAPAARYRWETKGDYRVSLAVVWQGSYTFSGFGVVGRTESLGPVTGQPQTVPYHVVEVRSVPSGPSAP